MSKTRPQSKAGWEEIADKRHYFRSQWEVYHAKYLQLLKDYGQIKDWLYEPQTFWFEEIKRGTRSYLPDFKVIENDGSHCWHEVKGYLCSKSKTKLKRMQKYYPEEKVYLVQKEQIEEIKKKFSFIFRANYKFGQKKKK